MLHATRTSEPFAENIDGIIATDSEADWIKDIEVYCVLQCLRSTNEMKVRRNTENQIQKYKAH